MPLGIEINNTAPQLIQNSGAALVQGIRQIGQQISGHLTEIQTKRDLGAMAQELQGINVQSNEFPVQLTQMLSRHPLAARDERGQMALSILGKAHGQWQAGEAETRAFERAMKMEGIRTQNRRDQFDYEEDARRKRPVEVGGQLVGGEDEIDPVTGQRKILAAAPPRGTAAGPRVLSPGAVLVGPTGEKIAENPAAPKQMDDYKKAQLRRQQRNDLKATFKAQVAARDKDMRELEDSIRKVDAEEKEMGEKFRPERAAERLAWQQKLLATQELREAALKEMQKIDSVPDLGLDDEAPIEPEPGAAPTGAVLPAPGAIAPAAAPSDLPVLTPAQAAKLPSGTQFKGTNGRIYTAP